MAASTMAQTSRWSGDWFEIEVILLANIADKKVIKEVFDNTPDLPDYQHSLDILAGFLQPDIASLKQQLPNCQNRTYDNALMQNVSLPDFVSLKSLDQIDAEFPDADVFERFIIEEQQAQERQLALQLESQASALNLEQNDADDLNTNNNTDINHSLTDEESVDLASIEHTDVELQQTEELIEAGLNEEQRQLVANAESTFSPIQFNYAEIAKPVTGNWCAISQTEYDSLNADPTLYSYLGYSVDVMPPKATKAEYLYSDSPYLISQDSLKLNDVFRQMRRSRNFRPLLHVGWRQQVFEANKSTPVKLYAGENLQHNYQVALTQFKQEQEQEHETEQALIDVINNANLQASNEPSLSLPEQKQLAKQHRLKEVLLALEQFDDQQPIDTINSQAAPLKYGDNPLGMESAPVAPIQPWHMDGFLNVFLVGNFLHIKADFSMVNLTLAEQETLNLRPGAVIDIKPIRLSQRRRLISRETHYLDHPYMGLIVQIRRHKRPEKPSEFNLDIE